MLRIEGLAQLLIVFTKNENAKNVPYDIFFLWPIEIDGSISPWST
jgi:hypothetical protein